MAYPHKWSPISYSYIGCCRLCYFINSYFQCFFENKRGSNFGFRLLVLYHKRHFCRCRHHSNWGSRHPIAAHYSFIDPERMKGCLCLCYFCMYLVNVHFIDIPHTFIPHFTLHSAKKNPHQIFRKLPLDNFQHSAIRIPQNTPSPLRIYFHVDFCPLITTLCLRPVRNDRMTGST